MLILSGEKIMSTEVTVEIKEPLDSALSKLKSQGFIVSETFTINDSYFTAFDKENVNEVTYEELLSKSVLVRNVIDSSGERNYIIYKNKKLDKEGNVVSEDKIESKIESDEKIKQILKSSGMMNWCNIKNNSLVLQRGIMSFCIQSIENLGDFIEYEATMIHSGLNSENKFKVLEDEIKRLNLVLGTDFSCKKPYMLLKKQTLQ